MKAEPSIHYGIPVHQCLALFYVIMQLVIP